MLVCVRACVWRLRLEEVSVGQQFLGGPPGVVGSPVTPLWAAPLSVCITGGGGNGTGFRAPRVVVS